MKEIPGYEGLYACDENGLIYSLARVIKKRAKKGGRIFEWRHELRELKSCIRKDGYRGVALRKDGLHKSKLVHRLIGETFLSVPTHLDINHIDGNKINNNLNNLEICSRSENVKHAFKLGLRNHKGSSHPQYFIDKTMREKIKMLLNSNITQQKIAKIVGVHQTTISAIKLNKFIHRET